MVKLQGKFSSKREKEIVFGFCDQVSILSLHLDLVLVVWDRAKKPMT